MEELREKKIEFSEEAQRELGVLCDALSEILGMTIDAFVKDDVEAAYRVEPLEQVIDDLKALLRDRHVLRLKDGACTVEAGFIWSDLLTNLERASDHCSNIAVCIIDAAAHNMNAHQALHRIRKENPSYKAQFEAYSRKYSISN